MTTFYIELHSGPDTTIEAYEIEARDLNEALGIAAAYVAGACRAGISFEIRGISQSKTRGRKYVNLF